jgi:peptidoglycan-associated lipoprotein
MMTRFSAFVCAVAFAALFLAGCEQSVSRIEETPSGLRVETPVLAAPQNRVALPETKTDLCPDCAARIGSVKAAPPLREATPMLSDIYFDYDKYNIRPHDAQILRGNMEWFKANPGRKVRIEGYCDERGTGDYNIRLGERRAETTKNFLVGLGVDGGLLEVATYGRERPERSDHNMQAWAKNRRIHFVPIG